MVGWAGAVARDSSLPLVAQDDTKGGWPELPCRPEYNEGPQARGTGWAGVVGCGGAQPEILHFPLVVHPDTSSFYNSEIAPSRAEKILL
jgi:hypothetical protein